MTENDIKYRQGRTKRQVESNYKVMQWAVYGLVGAGILILLNTLFLG